MTSIDKRIVQMEFDNAQFEMGIKTSVESLKNLDKNLQLKNGAKGFEDASKAADEFEKSTDYVGKSVVTLQSKFDAFGSIAFSVLQRLTNAAITLGTNLANALTLQPIQQGFAEYELGIGSTQTIINATGESVDTVDKKLAELNKYSDDTIYKFSDMTTAVGKFTNAGVGLNDAVLAIQGISNEAALAGATTQQASSAMYNFSQALSTGYLSLLDWRSIENAMMATQEFRQELINTGLEMGTLVEVEGKYISTTQGANGATSDAFTAMSGFRDSLSSQWITNDVLIATLGKYADTTTDLGQRAFRAATEVKTFSQMVDTAAEAMGTGWADSFKLIFGNYEEAKDLWTGVSTVLDNMISSYHNARNEQLKMWRDMGGRDLLIQGVANAWQGVSGALGAVGDGFRSAFPDNRAEILMRISEAVAKLGDKLKLSDEQLQKIRDTSTKFFGAVSNIFSGLGGILSTLLSPLRTAMNFLGGVVQVIGAIAGGAGRLFLEVFSRAGESIKAFGESLHGSVEPLDSFREACSKAADKVREFFGSLVENLPSFDDVRRGAENMAKGVQNALSKAGDAFKRFFKLSSKSMDETTEAQETFADKLSRGFERASETIKTSPLKAMILDPVSEGLSAAGARIKEFLSTATFGDVFNFATGAGAVLIANGVRDFIAHIDEMIDEVKAFFSRLSGAVGEGAEEVSTELEPLDNTLRSLSEVLMSYANNINASSLIMVAVAIGILAQSILTMSQIDEQGLVRGTTALVVLAGAVVALAWAIGYFTKQQSLIGTGTSGKGRKGIGGFLDGILGVFKGLGAAIGYGARMTGLGVALWAIGQSVKTLAEAIATIASVGDEDAVGQATTVIVVLIGLMTAVIHNLGSMDKVKLSTGLLSLLGFVIAVKQLLNTVGQAGSMATEDAIQGLAVVGLVIAGLIGSMLALSKISQLESPTQIVDKILTMIVFAGVVKSLGNTLKNLSSIGWEGVAVGLTAMGGAIAEFIGAIAAMNYINGKIGGGKAFNLSTVLELVGIAIVLSVLGDAMKELSELSWEGMVTALGAMGGALAEFIGAVAALTAISGIGKVGIGQLAALVVVALTMKTVGDALKNVADLSWEQIGQSLVAMGGALAELTAVVLILGDIGGLMSVVGAASLWVGVDALASLAETIRKLSEVNMDGMGERLAALGGFLGEITASNLLNFFGGPGALALNTASEGIGKMVDALKNLSGVEVNFDSASNFASFLKELADGLQALTLSGPGALALDIASLGAGFVSVTDALGYIQNVASNGDLKQLGEDISAFLKSLSDGLNSLTLSGLGAGSAAAAGYALSAIGPNLQYFTNVGDLGQLGTDIGTLLKAIGDGVSGKGWEIISAGVMSTAIDALASLGPKLTYFRTSAQGADQTAANITSILTAISGGIGNFTGMEYSTAGLQSAVTHLQSVADLSREYVNLDAETISTNMNTLLSGLSSFSSSISELDTDKMAAVSEKMDPIATAMRNFGEAVNAMAGYISNGSANIASNVETILSSIEQMCSTIESKSPEASRQVVEDIKAAHQEAVSEVESMFAALKNRVTTGFDSIISTISQSLSRIEGMRGRAYNAGRSLTEAIGNGIHDGAGNVDMTSIGANMVQGLINGIESKRLEAEAAAASLASAVASASASALGEHSPSKIAFEQGENWNKGLANGINSTGGLVIASIEDVARALARSLDEYEHYLQVLSNSNISPTITPVLRSGDGISKFMTSSTTKPTIDMDAHIQRQAELLNQLKSDDRIAKRLESIDSRLENFADRPTLVINGMAVNDDDKIRKSVFDILDRVVYVGGM